MIQGYSATLFGDQLGADMELTLYAVFTVVCFAAPPVTNMLGAQLTMFIGIVGYAMLVLAALLYNLELVGSWCVIAGGACTGVGAALLWTGQGRLMLEYSDGTDAGHIFAIFWSIFNASAVLGGLFTFAYFSTSDSDGNTALYVIFLALILGGGALTLLLEKPSVVRARIKAEEEETGVRSGARTGGGGEEAAAPLNKSEPPTLAPADAAGGAASLNAAAAEEGGAAGCGAAADGHVSWLVELRETLALFGTRKMVFLTMIFFYTGYNQPYQLVTFGNRFFNSANLGLALALFYCFEIVGSFAAGWLLDGTDASPDAPMMSAERRRANARRSLGVFALVTTIGYGFALALEWPRAGGYDDDAATVDGRGAPAVVAMGGAAMAFWGFSDAQIQAYAYWLIRASYGDGAAQARAVGFFKLTQSAGWCVGFALSPAARMAPLAQLAATAAAGVVGSALALRELPPLAPATTPPEDAAGGEYRALVP